MKRILLIITLLSALFLISCTSAETSCTLDADCTADACCHATGAVNKDYSPDCKGKICTLQCEPGTLDCGQGQVKCLENKCTVVLNE